MYYHFKKSFETTFSLLLSLCLLSLSIFLSNEETEHMIDLLLKDTCIKKRFKNGSLLTLYWLIPNYVLICLKAKSVTLFENFELSIYIFLKEAL